MNPGLPPSSRDRTPTFDPTEDLSGPILSLEASAGTGKTHALAGLAVRMLAEGVISTSELLMVTFTRAATGELRDRVRERLVEAVASVGAGTGADDGPAGPSEGRLNDPLLDWLRIPSKGGDERELRSTRLERALAEFDAATITTIHGFASQVLGSLGIACGTAAEVRLVDDLEEAIVEVCSDLLAGRAVDPDTSVELPGWSKLTAMVLRASASADVEVVPAADAEDASPEDRLLAELVREAVELLPRRRASSGSMGFDDLLVALRRALRSESGRGAAAAALRSRYRVALIDEFQDTDPVQWEIFHMLFGSEHPDGGAPTAEPAPADAGEGPPPVRRLVLVGDPKQAIYSFRGADVHTYVRAVGSTAGMESRRLTTNWRSSADAVAATNALFDGFGFGDGIGFERVQSAPLGGPALTRIDDDGTMLPQPALVLRCGIGEHLRRAGKFDAEPCRRAVMADLAREAVDLLEHGRFVAPDGRDSRPVRPDDIAVLVRSRKHAQEVQEALEARGVPSVLARGGTVLESPAARQMVLLLEAVARPSDHRRVRAYGVSWFGGEPLSWAAEASDDQLAAVQARLVGWSEVLAAEGVGEFLGRVWRDSDVVAARLAGPDGDREVTDLNHVAELLRCEAGDSAASPAGLLSTLDRMGEGVRLRADTDADSDVTSRRIESDADAVTIMTVWVAKGLEFPIVMCPTMWSRPAGSFEYHDPDTGRRILDVRTQSKVGKKGADAVARARAEHDAEEMRLLYVALTRARNLTVLWWVPGRSASSTALARVLFARDERGYPDPGALDGGGATLPEPDRTLRVLDPLVGRADGRMRVVEMQRPEPRPQPWQDRRRSRGPDLDGAATLSPARLSSLDVPGTRWSFSRIVARDRAPSDPWDLSVGDEGAGDEQRPPDSDASGAVPEPNPRSSALPMAGLPAGAAFGTLVHEVLEIADWSAVDLRAELSSAVRSCGGPGRVSLRPVADPRPSGDPAAESTGEALLVEGLVQVLSTPLPSPLGGDQGGRRLRDLGANDVLRELTFELNLATSPGGTVVTDRHIGELLLGTSREDDPFRGWARRLASGAFGVQLAGHLTGSIDAVVRVGASGPGVPDRFVVVDHKTNRLHDAHRGPSPGDYGREAMIDSMVQHDYPLQALLYSVALHRYLRWRLPGYEPEHHLGGCAYLFLRGMRGEQPDVGRHEPADTCDGLLLWDPPARTVVELSDLLDGRHALLERGASTRGVDRAAQGGSIT